jgi:hypothetical protein
MYESPFGKRWTCYGCSALFFDMKKKKAVCPKCGANQAENPTLHLVGAIKAKPTEEDAIVAEIELNDDDDSSTEGNGIASLEEMEERMNQQGEEEDAM